MSVIFFLRATKSSQDLYKNEEIFKDLIQTVVLVYLISLTVFLEIF